MKAADTLSGLWSKALLTLTKPLRDEAERNKQIETSYQQTLDAKAHERERLMDAFRTSLASHAANGTTETATKVLEAAEHFIAFEKTEHAQEARREIFYKNTIQSGC